MARKTSRTLTLLALGLLAACSSKSGKSDSIGGKTVSLVGRVYSADTGQALGGAKISDAHGASVTSDAHGRFSLEHASESSQITIAETHYADSQKSVPSSDAYLEVYVKKADTEKKFDPAVGAELTAMGAVTVNIPQKGLATKDGKDPSGQVTAQLSTIDTKSPLELTALPGEGKAASSKGDGQFAVVAALDLSAKDAHGNALTTKDGKTIDAAFAAPEGGKAQLGLFSYNTKSGRWESEGTVALDPQKKAYHGKIKHLSWWAVGEVIDELSCVRGCVKSEDGKPAAGARVTVIGIDYASVLSLFSDEQGCFAVDVKAGGQAAVSAIVDGGVTPTKAVTASTTLMRAADDAASCGDLGTLSLHDVNANATCPGGLSSCGAECADTSRDYQNCGACGTVCEDGTFCIAGKCGTSAPPAMTGGHDAGSTGSSPDVTMLTLEETTELCAFWTAGGEKLNCEQQSAVFKDNISTTSDCQAAAQQCERDKAAGSDHFADCKPSEVMQSFKACKKGAVTLDSFETCFAQVFAYAATRSCTKLANKSDEPACMQQIIDDCPGLFDHHGDGGTGGGPDASSGIVPTCQNPGNPNQTMSCYYLSGSGSSQICYSSRSETQLPSCSGQQAGTCPAQNLAGCCVKETTADGGTPVTEGECFYGSVQEGQTTCAQLNGCWQNVAP